MEKSSSLNISSHIPLFASQNLANAQYFSLSKRVKVGPSYFWALSKMSLNSAFNVPSNLLLIWLPSQKGEFLLLPHLHNATGDVFISKTPSFAYSMLMPSSSTIMVCLTMGGVP